MNLALLKLFRQKSEPHHTESSTESYQHLLRECKRLVNLEMESAKLALAEKLTLLLSRIALTASCFVIAACVVIFLSMSMADLLLETFTPWFTYLIVACFYTLLIIIVIACRRALIINPIARYISIVLLSPDRNVQSPAASPRNEPQEL